MEHVYIPPRNMQVADLFNGTFNSFNRSLFEVDRELAGGLDSPGVLKFLIQGNSQEIKEFWKDYKILDDAIHDLQLEVNGLETIPLANRNKVRYGEVTRDILKKKTTQKNLLNHIKETFQVMDEAILDVETLANKVSNASKLVLKKEGLIVSRFAQLGSTPSPFENYIIDDKLVRSFVDHDISQLRSTIERELAANIESRAFIDRFKPKSGDELANFKFVRDPQTGLKFRTPTTNPTTWAENVKASFNSGFMKVRSLGSLPSKIVTSLNTASAAKTSLSALKLLSGGVSISNVFLLGAGVAVEVYFQQLELDDFEKENKIIYNTPYYQDPLLTEHDDDAAKFFGEGSRFDTLKHEYLEFYNEAFKFYTTIFGDSDLIANYKTLWVIDIIFRDQNSPMNRILNQQLEFNASFRFYTSIMVPYHAIYAPSIQLMQEVFRTTYLSSLVLFSDTELAAYMATKKTNGYQIRGCSFEEIYYILLKGEDRVIKATVASYFKSNPNIGHHIPLPKSGDADFYINTIVQHGAFAMWFLTLVTEHIFPHEVEAHYFKHFHLDDTMAGNLRRTLDDYGFEVIETFRASLPRFTKDHLSQKLILTDFPAPIEYKDPEQLARMLKLKSLQMFENDPHGREILAKVEKKVLAQKPSNSDDIHLNLIIDYIKPERAEVLRLLREKQIIINPEIIGGGGVLSSWLGNIPYRVLILFAALYFILSTTTKRNKY